MLKLNNINYKKKLKKINILLFNYFNLRIIRIGKMISNIDSINCTIDDILNTFYKKLLFYGTRVAQCSDEYELEMIENIVCKNKIKIFSNTLFNAIKCMRMKIVSLIFSNLSDSEKSTISLSDIIKFIPKPLLDSDIYKYFWIELIKFMIDQKILPCNDQTTENTFSLAIKTNNLTLINQILVTNPIPYNSRLQSSGFYNEPVTLTHAVNTKNIEIIKLALQRGAMPHIFNDYNNRIINTLKVALKTLDYDIIRLIIINGGKIYDYSSGNYYENNDLFSMFFEQYANNYFNTLDQNLNKDKINRIINYIMCCGAKIDDKMYTKLNSYISILKIHNNIESEQHEFLKSKVESCYKLLNQKDKSNPLQIQLINELKETMKEIIDPVEKKEEIIQRIDDIPECLIDIIYQYYHLSMVDFIYWNQYNL